MRRKMTEQIEELRLKGLGYKSIALVVGTSERMSGIIAKRMT